MIKLNQGKDYLSTFNTETGAYGRVTDPFCCPFPELLDISIIRKCTRKCSFCYMGSSPDDEGATLSVKDLKKVLDQCGSVFQIALGGGEPTIHPEFVEMLRTIKEDYNIVPNYTTNGDNLTPEVLEASKKYCGAVAVSVYDLDHTIRASKLLIRAGVKTNWHWVVSKSTIRDIIKMLKDGVVPEGLNACIFLLHKPVGRGTEKDNLTIEDPIQELFDTVKSLNIKGGFDACFMNYIVRYQGDEVDKRLVDFCDAGRYTAYVDTNLDVKPCSFGQVSYGNLYTDKLTDIWKNKFQPYRDGVLNSVCKDKGCSKFKDCYSGCPILPINVCADRGRLLLKEKVL